MKNIKQFQFNNKIIKASNIEENDVSIFKNYLDKKYKDFDSMELKKSPEEIKFIELLNKIIEEEFNNLNLDFKKINLNQIKFLKELDFKKYKDSDNIPAFFDVDKNIIVLNHDHSGFLENRFRLLVTLIHEMIHYYSFQKYNIESEEEKLMYYSERVGYTIKNYKKREIKFIGLDEAVVDICTQEIIKKNQQTFIKELNISKDEKDSFKFADMYFYEYSYFIRALIRKMANNNKEKEEVLLNSFIQGQFSGNMMHLREIEKFFGKDSLRILSKLGTNEKNDEFVFNYFDKKL